MIQINLLPWRKKARHIKKMQFTVGSILFFFLTIFALAIFHIYFSLELRKQLQLNTYLQNEINIEEAALTNLDEAQQDEINLMTQLKFIMNLYNKSFRAVQMLNELYSLVPNNISLNRVERIDNLIKLSGSAQSNSDVSSFKQAIEKSLVFYNPSVSEITSEKNSNRVNFQLEVLQKE